jgi:hypothetical protein
VEAMSEQADLWLKARHPHFADAPEYVNAFVDRVNAQLAAAAAELTALRERVAEVSQERDAEYDLRRNTNALLKDALARAEAAEADAARLRGVIDRYADHDRDCAYAVSLKLGCDCGFDAAMSERK